jgi:hypothetical protein
MGQELLNLALGPEQEFAMRAYLQGLMQQPNELLHLNVI